MNRQIRFPEILRLLLDGRGSKETRKHICDAVRVSQSVITQYLHATSSPRLETLVKLAESLGVDLDYLVFGETEPKARRGDADYSDIISGIHQSVSSVHQYLDSHRWALTRISSLLLQEIDRAAATVANECKAAGALIHDDELTRIEPLSGHTIVLRRTLQNELPTADTASSKIRDTPMVRARFFPVVADNLKAGNRYSYVIQDDDVGSRAAADFVETLRRGGVSPPDMANLAIGGTATPIVTGFILYRLSPVGIPEWLRMRFEPFLYQPSDVAWLGCSLPPSTLLQSNPLMDGSHVEQALRMFRTIASNRHKRFHGILRSKATLTEEPDFRVIKGDRS